MFSRHLVTESRIQLEESRAFERDLQKVNQQLALELKSTENAFECLHKEKKLVDLELKNERAVFKVRS